MTVMTHPHRTKTSILPGSTRQQNGVPVLQVPTIKTSTPEKKTHTTSHNNPRFSHSKFTVATPLPPKVALSPGLFREAHGGAFLVPILNLVLCQRQGFVIPVGFLAEVHVLPRRRCKLRWEEKKTVVAMVVENAMGVEKPVCHW